MNVCARKQGQKLKLPTSLPTTGVNNRGRKGKQFIVSGSAPASLYERYMKVFGLASVSFRKL